MNNSSSSNNDNEKRDQPSNKSFPINLTGAKLNLKPQDVAKNSVILGAQSLRALNQSHMRVITNPVPTNLTTSSTTGQAIISTIVPQTMLKQGKVKTSILNTNF